MEQYLAWAIEAAKRASQEILQVYRQQSFAVEMKEDDTPVTLADERANQAIEDYLGERTSFPVLAEELSAEEIYTDKSTIWVVDPLDGTKEFIKRNHQFSVNIALIHKKRPVLGVTLMPVYGDIFYAVKGQGAYHLCKGVKERIQVSDRLEHLRMLRSRNTLSKRVLALCEREEISTIKKIGSAYKGCLIAKGEGEVYISDGKTMEWDVASIDILVHEAGGLCRDLEGNLLKYNRGNHENKKGFFIVNRKENILWI